MNAGDVYFIGIMVLAGLGFWYEAREKRRYFDRRYTDKGGATSRDQTVRRSDKDTKALHNRPGKKEIQ